MLVLALDPVNRVMQSLLRIFTSIDFEVSLHQMQSESYSYVNLVNRTDLILIFRLYRDAWLRKTNGADWEKVVGTIDFGPMLGICDSNQNKCGGVLETWLLPGYRNKCGGVCETWLLPGYRNKFGGVWET